MTLCQFTWNHNFGWSWDKISAYCWWSLSCSELELNLMKRMGKTAFCYFSSEVHPSSKWAHTNLCSNTCVLCIWPKYLMAFISQFVISYLWWKYLSRCFSESVQRIVPAPRELSKEPRGEWNWLPEINPPSYSIFRSNKGFYNSLRKLICFWRYFRVKPKTLVKFFSCTIWWAINQVKM